MAKKFAVFDIDGTLIRWQLMHATFNELGKQGHLPPEAFATIVEARKRWKNRPHEEAFREYELTFVRVIEEFLQGIGVDAFEAADKAALENYRDQVYRYTRELIRELKKQGYFLLAISGSHDTIVQPLTEYYGFDDFVATQFVQKSGKFTGEVVLHMRDKAAALKRLMAKHQLLLEGSIGIGDSESDIAMLELVENPIVFNPTKKLFGHAKGKGWDIVLERKNVIYKLEQQDGQYILA